MPRKRLGAEQINPKLREAEVDLAKGQTVAQVCKKIGVTEQTYYRWRMEYGGLRTDQAKLRSKTVLALIDLQLLTGARAGELTDLRTADIDCSDDVWKANLADHKTSHLGKNRTLHFGPQAQKSLAPRQSSEMPQAPLFAIQRTTYAQTDIGPTTGMGGCLRFRGTSAESVLNLMPNNTKQLATTQTNVPGGFGSQTRAFCIIRNVVMTCEVHQCKKSGFCL